MDAIVRECAPIVGPVEYYLCFIAETTIEHFRKRVVGRLRERYAHVMYVHHFEAHSTAKIQQARCHDGRVLYQSISELVDHGIIRRIPIEIGNPAAFGNGTIYLPVLGEHIHTTLSVMFEHIERQKWGCREYHRDIVPHITIAKVELRRAEDVLRAVRRMPDVPIGQSIFSTLYLCEYDIHRRIPRFQTYWNLR